jgi:hypothetical protein
MASTNRAQSSYSEGEVLLALYSIKQGQFSNIRGAAKASNIPESTLRGRVHGSLARRDRTPNSRKLTNLEEQALVEHLLDLDSRGFGPTVQATADMANYLLEARGGTPVGKNWASNFITRTPELKTRYNRKYNYERARCEDPAIIKPWFELVQATVAKYGITAADTYNFDETGFQMGVISTSKVVTGSERRNAPKTTQPGNREWVTVIQAVSAEGYAVQPFIILAGKQKDARWFQEIPQDWPIQVSNNGWTTNEIGLQWLHHFDQNTKAQGTYRLLILDGHESHNSLEFKLYCKENNIITLCMPPHSSHLLQPLDVGCFAPLKALYGNQIQHLMRMYIHHITKLEFLPAFKTAFYQAFKSSNIRAGFRASGLVPFDPEEVLSKLDIQLSSSTPPPPPAAAAEQRWVSKTPKTTAEIELQSDLLRDWIQKHQTSSPNAVLTSLDQLAKGAQAIANQATLVKAQVAQLQEANQVLAARKRRQRKVIQHQGPLTGAAIADQQQQAELDQQIGSDIRQTRLQGVDRARRQYTCSGCGERGHRINQCSQRR